jgi:hypothetical protein
MKKNNLIIILFFISLTLLGQDNLIKKNENYKRHKLFPSIVNEDYPLIVLNSKKVNYQIIEKLKEDKIKSINVLKDSSSIIKYGELGKNGTLEITSKNISKKKLDKLYKEYSIDNNDSIKSFVLKGKVVDFEGNEVIGATILTKGTINKAISDFDGKFTLKVNNEDVLNVTAFGYKPKDIIIENKLDINISLEIDSNVEVIRVLKPIIYLYPKEKTEVTLSFEFKGKLLTTFPKYDKNWNVIAEPNGQIFDTKTKRNYSSLFWDGDISFEPEHYQYESGFIVYNENLAEFLIEKLEFIGLNTTETNEFVQFWLPILEQKKYNFIHFLVNDECNEVSINNVNPNPDTTIRVYMEYYGLDEYTEIKEQELLKTERKGFTLVEWGGSDVSNIIVLEDFIELNKLPKYVTLCNGKKNDTKDVKPIYIIDKKIASKSMFDKLHPSQIKKIKTLGGYKSSALYGDQGVGGAFIVETNNK